MWIIIKFYPCEEELLKKYPVRQTLINILNYSKLYFFHVNVARSNDIYVW